MNITFVECVVKGEGIYSTCMYSKPTCSAAASVRHDVSRTRSKLSKLACFLSALNSHKAVSQTSTNTCYSPSLTIHHQGSSIFCNDLIPRL